MIEKLKDDDVINMVGGRFKLTAMIQKRWNEILQGSRFLVKNEGMTDMEAIVQEISEGKVYIDYENSDVPRPEELE